MLFLVSALAPAALLMLAAMIPNPFGAQLPLSLLDAAFIFAAMFWTAAICLIDFRLRRIPNWLVLFGTLALFLSIGLARIPGTLALLGASLWGGVYLGISVVAPRSLGAGDAKLAFVCGGLLAIGQDSYARVSLLVVEAMLLSSISTLAIAGFTWAIFLIRSGTSAGRKKLVGMAVPHAPAMFIALWGQAIPIVANP